jgi:hypothetical protein
MLSRVYRPYPSRDLRATLDAMRRPTVAEDE